MELFLGIDLGTSYFKVGLFDADGRLRGLGRVAVEPVSPAEGRFELPAEQFWQRLRTGLHGALTAAGAGAAAIRGVSYSSQANTFLLLDDAERELTPLVFWHDQRARPLAPELAGFGATTEHQRRTGLTGAAPERAPAKCRWFAVNEPALWAKAKRVMTISDYFTWSLTGERHGDAATAALTGLYDLTTRTWWPEALRVNGLEAGQLSAPLPPGATGGRTTQRAGDLLGLPAGIPFAVGTLDHHAAAIGSGIGHFADASLSTGTVLAALVLTDRIEAGPQRIFGAHTDDRRFYVLAFHANGAGQIEEYQRQHAPGLSIDDLITRAGENSPDVHGAAMRRMLEGIVGSQAQLLVSVSGGAPLRRVAATGGGARSPVLLQLQADRLRVAVATTECAERACLGAASFATVAAGVHSTIDAAAARMVRPAQEYRPRQLHA